MLSPNQIEEIKEQAYLGLPSSLGAICKIYPLTISEIVGMGSNKYNGRLHILLMTEIDIANLIKEKTGEEIPLETIDPLDYLIQSAAIDDTFLLELQSIFSTFVKEDVLILPKIRSVLIGSPEEKRLVNSSNFRDFQDILRIQNKKKVKEPPPEKETPLQKKYRLLREKVAQAKKKKAEKDGGGQNLMDLMEIAQVFGIDVKNCTLYALYNLVQRYQLKEKWQQDLQMLCAGADSKKLKTQYWGESLRDKQEVR